MEDSEDLTPSKRNLEAANFIQTPEDEIVESFENALTWYRDNCMRNAQVFPAQPSRVAAELISHDINLTTLIKMVFSGSSSRLISNEFDGYSLAKYELWVKNNYTEESLSSFQDFSFNLPPPVEESKRESKKGKKTHQLGNPKPVPRLRMAKLDGDFEYLELKKDLKKASFTYPGIANLTLKTLSRTFAVVRALKEDGLSGSVALTNEKLKRATSCGCDIFQKGKNLVTCALLDFEFLTSTLKAQKNRNAFR